MKKANIIAILAILVIVCLQGYNVNLQYQNYILRYLDKTSESLIKAIDEEYHDRAKSPSNKDKDGIQHIKYRIFKSKDDIPKEMLETMKKEPVNNLQNLDIGYLKRKGIINSSADAMLLLDQDFLEEQKKPLNLRKLDKIFSRLMGSSNEHCMLLLDKNKKVIDSIGKENPSWNHTKDVAVNLKELRFVRVATQVSPSSFIIQTTWTLCLSFLFLLISIGCVGYQLHEIKIRNELLRKRELSVNGIIHDLKAPINSVLSVLNLLKIRMNADETLLPLIAQASEKARLLITDIESILLTAKGGKTRIILNIKKADILQIAETAKSDIDVLYKQKKHTIEIADETNRACIIKIDKMYMCNVLRNLLENALKYSDEGVIVNVLIQKKGSRLFISIKDNGWGISHKDQKHIFDQFFRVAHPNGPKGFGIGLSAVKYIVEAHHGKVSVQSEVGKGSIFTLTLPYNLKEKEL